MSSSKKTKNDDNTRDAANEQALMKASNFISQKLELVEKTHIRAAIEEDGDHYIIDPTPGQIGPLYRISKEHVKISPDEEAAESQNKLGTNLKDVFISQNAPTLKIEAIRWNDSSPRTSPLFSEMVPSTIENPLDFLEADEIIVPLADLTVPSPDLDPEASSENFLSLSSKVNTPSSKSAMPLSKLRATVEKNLVWHWGNVKDEVILHVEYVGGGRGESDRVKIHSTIVPSSCSSLLVCYTTSVYHGRRGYCYDGHGLAMDPYQRLLTGQSHNDTVQNLYRTLYTTIGSYEFWLLVATASDSKPNWNEAAENIKWQKRENPDSIREAKYKWENQESKDDTLRKVAAMAYLISGQRHNPNAIHIYRNCAKANMNDLFKLVSK